jgi:hypothetical protein
MVTTAGGVPATYAVQQIALLVDHLIGKRDPLFLRIANDFER